jgi:hypothetical protein
MLERIYIALLGLYVLTVGFFYVSGLLDALTAVVFGFVLFGLIFLGMIGVLPFYATHHKTPLKH